MASVTGPSTALEEPHNSHYSGGYCKCSRAAVLTSTTVWPLLQTLPLNKRALALRCSGATHTGVTCEATGNGKNTSFRNWFRATALPLTTYRNLS